MQRLKSRPQFQAALSGGIVSRTPHFALHRMVFNPRANVPPVGASFEPAVPTRLPLFPHADVWLGAMVPKRWARRAVTRNAIKRQVYTVCGALDDRFPPAAYVVRLRNSFDRKLFVSATSDVLKRAVRAEVQQLVARVLMPAPAAVATALDTSTAAGASASAGA